MIERRNLWRRAGGFYVGVGVSLIGVGVLGFAHWVECRNECSKQRARLEQIIRAEHITRLEQITTRAELVQECIAQHGSWIDKQRVQEVCEQQAVVGDHHTFLSPAERGPAEVK